MEATDGRSRVIAAIEESVCPDDDIEFVVAFGSQLTGDPRPSSDLDIGIKFIDELPAHERFRKRCFLSGDLQRADAPFVDISDLETLPVAIAHEAVRGEFLCGDEVAFRELKSNIEAAFESRREELRGHQRAVIDRIADNGLHG